MTVASKHQTSLPVTPLLRLRVDETRMCMILTPLSARRRRTVMLLIAPLGLALHDRISNYNNQSTRCGRYIFYTFNHPKRKQRTETRSNGRKRPEPSAQHFPLTHQGLSTIVLREQHNKVRTREFSRRVQDSGTRGRHAALMSMRVMRLTLVRYTADTPNLHSTTQT
ncbi:hypothetical protein J6590_003147 [Homalodisca vitripennis]|nr:hypothetical protein J6590_003147 [Homalodisca vitripennis]